MLLAFAAEAAAEAGHEAAEGGASSFPPFDASLFSSQLVWFALSFIAFYWIMANIALPKVAAVIAAREAASKRDLEAAASASADAEDARKAAEQAGITARTKAREMIDNMRAEAMGEFAAEQAKVEKTLAERGAVAEKRIAENRAKALEEVGPIAANLAKDIAGRVSGGVVGAT